jgi:hypothetical protein
MGGPETYKELQRWRTRSPATGGPPAWLPKSEMMMGTDVAAILSQIDIPPKRWKSVHIDIGPDGRATMTVTPKRGYPRVVQLPDRGAITEVTRLISSPSATASSAAERKRLEAEWARKQGDGIEVKVTGSP